MKKLALTTICLLALSAITHAQSVTLTIDAGLLENGAGTAVEPTGGLLQLIASPSGVFAAPTTSSYAGGDNVVVASFAASYTASAVQGETLTTTAYPLTTANYTLTSGEALLLRFYPTLTAAGKPTAPAANTSYGQVRSNTVEFTSDTSETAWVVPASGASKDLTYITMNDGGTYPNGANGTSDGVPITSFATLTVVPEPSTYAGGLLGCAVIAYAVTRSRRHQFATVPGQI